MALLSECADSITGLQTGDNPAFICLFWEQPRLLHGWAYQQRTVSEATLWGGREQILYWQNGQGVLVKQPGVRINCASAIGKKGIAVHRMAMLRPTLFTGEILDQNAAAIIPTRIELLPAIWEFIASDEFTPLVRELDTNTGVAPATLVQVPFDLAHWQRVAAEKYPHGLPKPFSSDPTQWLFNGHPKGSDQPLQVAVARLLGYRWSRQTGSSFPDCPALGPDGLESHADDDGIVCLQPLRGERAAADRLRGLLSAAFGTYDEHALIVATEGKAKTLEDWLRDEFFVQHCTTFQNCPFIWHIWDGLADGFHALVNYHLLAAPDGAGRKLLETLAFVYLGDWIRKQQDDLAHKKPGAEDRLIAAQSLQGQLKAILAGEPPYDIFVRWKPLGQQAIGWAPDINDGVRLNIRPFMLARDVGRKGAGILRAKPNIKWDKDRGTDPSRPKGQFPWFWTWDEATADFAGGAKFDGCRWNDCHYTTVAKRAARERHNPRK